MHSPSPGCRAPIVTLTTDFGLEDWYVAAVKAVLFSHCADARLVDMTHLIRPGDIIQAAVTIERAVAAFSPGTIHLVVVDPGVGSGRRMLIARISGQWIVCPDNGLITWAYHRQGGARTWELTWRPAASSGTFHARDIMGPAAGMLAAGRAVEALAKPILDPVLLNIAPAQPGARSGQIIHIDHFGNATTNIPAEVVGGPIVVGDRTLGPVKRTYSDVPAGDALALIGSSDLLEIAVRDGSAAQMLGLRVGDPVSLGE